MWTQEQTKDIVHFLIIVMNLHEKKKMLKSFNLNADQIKSLAKPM